MIQEDGKTVCISGCSHRGVLNIVRGFCPDVLVGGFHFMKLDPQTADAPFLELAAQELLSYPAVYYTGHCTGEKAYAFLKERMGDRLHSLSTGLRIVI
jgi:7,8-dihydropterin-6-yl-methyl-4-(beta-D-ribofuranosyl)aminobenzene 5'-phosphate synthase